MERKVHKAPLAVRVLGRCRCLQLAEHIRLLLDRRDRVCFSANGTPSYAYGLEPVLQLEAAVPVFSFVGGDLWFERVLCIGRKSCSCGANGKTSWYGRGLLGLLSCATAYAGYWAEWEVSCIAWIDVDGYASGVA